MRFVTSIDKVKEVANSEFINLSHKNTNGKFSSFVCGGEEWRCVSQTVMNVVREKEKFLFKKKTNS